jgi:hypothetical protein
MNITKLIETLEKIKDKHGDIDCMYYDTLEEQYCDIFDSDEIDVRKIYTEECPDDCEQWKDGGHFNQDDCDVFHEDGCEEKEFYAVVFGRME